MQMHMIDFIIDCTSLSLSLFSPPPSPSTCEQHLVCPDHGGCWWPPVAPQNTCKQRLRKDKLPCFKQPVGVEIFSKILRYSFSKSQCDPPACWKHAGEMPGLMFPSMIAAILRTYSTKRSRTFQTVGRVKNRLSNSINDILLAEAFLTPGGGDPPCMQRDHSSISASLKRRATKRNSRNFIPAVVLRDN